MRLRVIVGLLAVLFVGIALLAQQSGDTQPPSFTSSTELVLVPAVVNDKAGAHIADLTKEDFALEEDGKAKPVALFEEIKASTSKFTRQRGENGSFSNFDQGGGGVRRLGIVVLDFVNTPFSEQSNARQSLIKFLATLGESRESICLLTFTRDGVKLIQNFADDPNILAEAVRKLPSNNDPLSQGPAVETAHPTFSVDTSKGDFVSEKVKEMIREMILQERGLQSLQRKDAAFITIQGFIQIANAFRGLPGRKSLVWASAGFPYSLSSPSMMLCEPACPAQQRDEVQPLYDKLWKTMNDAQIAIYSLDLRGLAANNSAAGSSSLTYTRPADVGTVFDSAAETRWQVQDSSNTLREFADNTGGKVFVNSNDLAEGFRQATLDNSSYYMLGYYVDRSKAKVGWHKISLTLRRKGARVRYRNGYFLTKDFSPTLSRQDIVLALSSAIDYTGIPITASWSGDSPGKEAGKHRVQFDLVLPSSFAAVEVADQNHLLVDIVAVARNAHGDVAGEMSQRIDSHLKPDALAQIRDHGMTYRSALQLPPGQYTVRFVVRDALGNRMGSVGAPLTVAASSAEGRKPEAR